MPSKWRNYDVTKTKMDGVIYVPPQTAAAINAEKISALCYVEEY